MDSLDYKYNTNNIVGIPFLHLYTFKMPNWHKK